MPDNKPTIREQWDKYRKTACRLCATDVERIKPFLSNEIHVVKREEDWLTETNPCAALPFEAWCAWRIERLEMSIEAALEHVLELEEAWRTGALSEHDCKGGTRSNRNVYVRISLRKALAAQPESGVTK